MKRKLFNNNGSTMVLLVVAIAVISMLGTSILGVTMMNYKIKKMNTDIKQSFYLSESGLDNAYANAYELISNAVQQANLEANDFIDDFTPANMEDYIGTVYINESAPDLEGNVFYSYDDVEIQNEAKNKFEDKYEKIVMDEDGDLEENGIIQVLKMASFPEKDTGEQLSVTVQNEGELSFASSDTITVEIQSEYTSEEDITKTTAVNLVVKVPKYNESYTVETKLISVNPYWTKVLAAERLIVESDSIFDGNVHVADYMSVNKTGITSAFNKDLAVKGDMYLGDISTNSSVTKVKNVYAENIYLEGNGTNFITDIGANAKICVEDDLEIKNNNQTVYIDGSYYGFTDGRYPLEGDGPNQSSSININETTGLSFTITNNLYLLGTSYVDAKYNGKMYQTGESLSVKGNYKAYLQPLFEPEKDKFKGENVAFHEYVKGSGNLRFADGFLDGGTMAAWDKADYIRYYQTEYGGLNVPDVIKINYEKTYSLGSTIDDENLKRATLAYDEDKVEFDTARNEYIKQTERLGYDVGTMEFIDQVKLSSLEAPIIDESNPSSNYVYINKDGGTKTLTAENYNGLIITNGDLMISGNVKSFKGAILCGGTVTVEGTGQKTFTYNKDIVSKIIAEYDLDKSIFGGSAVIEGDDVAVTTLLDGSAGDDVDFSNLLKLESWKIK